jgi:hypothetical protein
MTFLKHGRNIVWFPGIFVEIVNWIEPTQEIPGIYTYRFYRCQTITRDESPVWEIDDEDLPSILRIPAKSAI